MVYAHELFKLITVNVCNNKLMICNTHVDTGNSDLDDIINNININISLRDCINNNPETLNLLSLYSNQVNFNNIQYNVHSSYKICPNGIYDIQNNNALINYNFGSVNNVIYTKYNNLYILCCSIGKMFKYNKITNSITNCHYPKDYLFNTEFLPTINEMCNGNLITIGGGYINSSNCIDKVMIYNTSKDKWAAGPTLPYVAVNHATVIDNTDIYVISGYSEDCIGKVIRYRDDVWEYVASLEYDREKHIAFKFGNIIYAISGNTYRKQVPYIECYTILTGQWHTIKTDFFNGIDDLKTVYDNYARLFYMYDDNNIYCISLDNFTKTLAYSNIKPFDYTSSCLIMM